MTPLQKYAEMRKQAGLPRFLKDRAKPVLQSEFGLSFPKGVVDKASQNAVARHVRGRRAARDFADKHPMMSPWGRGSSGHSNAKSGMEYRREELRLREGLGAADEKATAQGFDNLRHKHDTQADTLFGVLHPTYFVEPPGQFVGEMTKKRLLVGPKKLYDQLLPEATAEYRARQVRLGRNP